MAGLNEEARIPVYINDEQAKSALKTLQNEADKWKRKMYEAMEGGDLKGMKEAEREIKKVNKQVSELKREAFDVNKVLSNLSTASTKDMKKAIQLLTRDMEGLTRKTKEYTDKEKQVQKLKSELYGVNTQLRTQQSLTSRVADGFNKYFGMATAAIASFTGIAFTVKSATEAYAKHDDILSDVKKTTGLTTDEVKELNKEFSKIDTRTTRENLNKIAEEGGRIGIAKDEILDFVRVMDIANVALGDSFQGGTEEIANMLGKLKFLYKETKGMEIEKSYLSIASAINELGAEGVASEQNITEFTTRVGALSDVLKPTISDALALGAGFEESGIQAEIASRAYSIVLNRAATGTEAFAQVMGKSKKEVEDLINFNPVDFFFAFAESLKGMNATETARTLDDLKVNADGANKVIGAAANNTDRFRELLLLSNKAFGEANSVITEFTEKNTNAQAKLEKARKVFSDMQLELGEKLTPAYASVIHKGSLFLKLISATVDILIKHGGLIISTTATIATYIIATKLATMWQTRFNTASLTSIATQKLQSLAFRAQFAAISLYNSVIALMTGNLKVAAIQFRAFSAALLANPIGIVAGAVVALGAGLYMLSKRLTDTEKVQKTLNSVNLEANKNIVEERLEVERLLKVAQNNLQSKEDRLAAIKKLNEISPQYLGNLTLENINTAATTESTKNYTKAILENAKVQAAKEKLIEIERKILDIQSGELSFMEEAKAAGVGYALGIRTEATANKDAADIDKYRAEQIKALILQKEKLTEITEKQNKIVDQTPIIPLAGINDFLPERPGYTSPGKPSPNKTKPTSTNIIADPEEVKKAHETAKDKAYATNIPDLSALLTADAEKQSAAVRAYFAKQGEGAFEAFIEAIEKQAALSDFSIADKFATSEEEQADPALDYAIAKYQETVDGKLEMNEAMWKAGKIGEQEYQDNLTKITAEAEENRLKIKQQKAEQVAEIAYMAGNLVSTLMDMELEKAGDNEEKKKEIRKKYADLNFAVTAAQIIANTAAAIMQGFAQLGPIGGAISAVLLGATGILQLGVANAQRKNVKSMADGGFAGYTGPGGKYEEAQLVQLHKKEYVIPSEGTQNPQLKPIIDVMEIARRNGSLARLDLRQIAQAIPSNGMAGGGFSSSTLPLDKGGNPPPGGGGGSYSDPILLELIRQSVKTNNELKEAADALRKEGTYTRLLGRNGFLETESNYQKMKTDITLQ